jgi:hypothetical protein
MTGADSDLWPANTEHAKSWDWQSGAPCAEVASLAANGADDDRLLAVVGRYTIENLILNAIHEIGEWFRFDGRRVFPAHSACAGTSNDHEDQGNGGVVLQLEFVQTPLRCRTVPGESLPDQHRGSCLVSRLAETAAATMFTYLPGTTISYEPAGPVITRWSDEGTRTAWRAIWSNSTLDVVDGDARDVVDLVAQDVHRALVAYEADRICRAFHIDRRRPWRLAAPELPLGADPPDTGASDAEWLSVSIEYARSFDAVDKHQSGASVLKPSCAGDASPVDLRDQPVA